MPKPNGRHRPRIPVNAVYRAQRAAGGPTAVTKLLGVSLPTLARWRRAGLVPDARAVFLWVEAIHPTDAPAQLGLGRRLAGLPPLRIVNRA